MKKITLFVSPSEALDPDFYYTKKSLRRIYPDAALIEVVPGQATILQPQNV